MAASTSSPHQEDPRVQLKCSFHIEGKEYETHVFDTKLVFKCTNEATVSKGSINYKDVLQVRVLQQVMDGKGNKTSSSTNPSSSALVIDYVHKYGIVDPKSATSIMPTSSKNFHWLPMKLILKCPTIQFAQCQKIADLINDYIQKYETQRPRNLLVFINPVGGKKKGVSIYEKIVHPIFQLGNVQTDVIVTKHATHALEVLQSYDLSKIDGLVSVGGDGTFTQIINGLIQRTATDKQIDLNDVEAELGQLPLRIGIIPSGTGQGCIKMATGTYDPATAAIHIVLGTEKEVNLMSVHNNGRLVHYASMLCCYGFFGDTIRDSEANRGLGRLRYPVAIIKNFVKFNKCELEIQMKTTPSPKPNKTSVPGYSLQPATVHNGSEDQGMDVADGHLDFALETRDGEWKSLRGRYLMANLWLWDLPGVTYCEQGGKVSRFLHLNRSWTDGSMLLQMVDSSAGRITMVKHFKDFITLDENVSTCSFAKYFECDAYRLTLVPAASKSPIKKERQSGISVSSGSEASSGQGASDAFTATLNVDGDPFVLNHPQIEIRLRRRMLRIFGCGIDEKLYQNLLIKESKRSN